MVSYIVDFKLCGHWEPFNEYHGLLEAARAAASIGEWTGSPARIWQYTTSEIKLVGIVNPPVSLD